MKLSEKSLEISLCCQLSLRLGAPHPFWFGLTQKQERVLGFDVATRIGARMAILQYKASDTVVSTSHFPDSARRFYLPHEQLIRLQAIAAQFPSSVHYVLPDIGNTDELSANPDLISQSWTLNVSQFVAPFPPSYRASGNHIAYLRAPDCIISSKPQRLDPMKMDALCGKLLQGRNNSKEMAIWLRDRADLLVGQKLYGFIF